MQTTGVNGSKTTSLNEAGGVTDYLPLLFSTLAVSWLSLSGYALFIYLTEHYGIGRKAIPCFVTWDIQLILTHLALALTRKSARSPSAGSA